MIAAELAKALGEGAALPSFSGGQSLSAAVATILTSNASIVSRPRARCLLKRRGQV